MKPVISSSGELYIRVIESYGIFIINCRVLKNKPIWPQPYLIPIFLWRFYQTCEAYFNSIISFGMMKDILFP